MITGSIYKTSDTPLAAWLVCNQVKLSEVDTKNNPVVFSFDCRLDQTKANDLIFQWDSGNATGNCNSFYKTYRQLVRMLKGNG